ncbi:hypothetical protein OBBRIDRAFT_807920 [Obba rivulosa]|uniref:Uncharacterized protein n=1 Tax=Obba rivulosa TaxID=1052685 RepID=A0A8E2AMC9_9APHY|nr:hypothetical protein OBBRIDRAFT_807920 [Obba rivulosa]
MYAPTHPVGTTEVKHWKPVRCGSTMRQEQVTWSTQHGVRNMVYCNTKQHRNETRCKLAHTVWQPLNFEEAGANGTTAADGHPPSAELIRSVMLATPKDWTHTGLDKLKSIILLFMLSFRLLCLLSSPDNPSSSAPSLMPLASCLSWQCQICGFKSVLWINLASAETVHQHQHNPIQNVPMKFRHSILELRAWLKLDVNIKVPHPLHKQLKQLAIAQAYMLS